VRLPPISESQLGDRLNKSASSLESLQGTIFRSFLQGTSESVVSGDKMMNKAWGLVWHRQHQRQGNIPEACAGWIRRPPGVTARVMGGCMGTARFVWCRIPRWCWGV
jgi:hypothetical protein